MRTEEFRSLALDLIDDEIETLKISRAKAATAKDVENIFDSVPSYIKGDLEPEVPKEE